MLINIADATPGMILSEDILLPNGTVLINASQALTYSLIAVLKRREIRDLQIISEASATESPVETTNTSTLQQTTKTATKAVPALENAKKNEPAVIKPVDVKATLAALRVIVSDDRLSAKLVIEPHSSGTTADLTAIDVLDFLNSKGIAYGINEKSLITVVPAWNKAKKLLELPDIAKGSMPTPGREGAITCKVKHLGTRADVDKAKAAKQYWELTNAGIDVQRVDKDTVLAEKEMGTPPIPGKTIAGELVPIKEIIRTKINLDSSVEFSKDEQTVIARQTGVAFYFENTIGVVPINFDGSAELVLTPDAMQADAIIHPPGTGGKAPSKEQLQTLLREKGITHGALNDKIKEIADNMGRGVYPEGPVTVASGTPVINGENGKIEFLFNIESSLKPKQNSDGSVDFKNVNLFSVVDKGVELAKLLPPTKGVPGKDITGREKPCTDGQPIKLPAGANTAAHPEKPDILVSTTEGNIKYTAGIIEIQEGFVIKGNVDFSTGNVNYLKSITVNGDIKAGFKVECGGDLQVMGTIEDADVIVNGNLLSKLGFIGAGKGLVDAKGDVNIGFMKNQTVRSRKSVVIAKEAINSTVYARKNITVHGNPLSIAGGMFVARETIAVYSVGNPSGIRTILEVGLDYVLVDELKKSDEQLTEIGENRRKLLETLKKYEAVMQAKKKLSPKEEFLLTKLKNTLVKYEQQIKSLDDRKKMILSKLHDYEHASIKIEHAAMPGTIFKIGERRHLVKEEVIGPKTVRLINQEIRIL